jgi:hypothetical protein
MYRPSDNGGRGRKAGALLMCLALLVSSVASTVRAADQERGARFITPSLVAPIIFEGLTGADDGNPTLEDAAQSDDGLVTFLAREPSHEGWQDHIGRVGLLVGASRTGFGMPINLPISAYSLHLAAGVGDVLWIGGVKRAAVTIVSTHISTAYLAKIDRQGRVIWEREYGDMTTQRSIQSVASLPSGNVIVSGQDSKRTWIALISHNGEIIWEHFVGIGKRVGWRCYVGCARCMSVR